MTQYYIRNKNAGYLGNSWMWYGKNGQGYTAYILGAHRFSEDEALEMVENDPEKCAMYKCDEVDKRLHLIFDSKDVKNLGTDAPCGWRNTEYAPLSRHDQNNDNAALVLKYETLANDLLYALEKVVKIANRKTVQFDNAKSVMVRAKEIL